jgi:methylated-DNA-[protein]-cysteine S-methyltransferase
MFGANREATVVVFATRMGWLGVCFHRESVIRTTLGHRQKSQAIKALGQPVIACNLTAAQQSLVDRLRAFARGEPVDFDDVLVSFPVLTNFQQRVLGQCRKLQWGETASYGTLARRAGRPKAARAVGATMAKNPLPIIIPCHRVVGATGLGGFSAPGGCRTKAKLLNAEGAW